MKSAYASHRHATHTPRGKSADLATGWGPQGRVPHGGTKATPHGTDSTQRARLLRLSIVDCSGRGRATTRPTLPAPSLLLRSLQTAPSYATPFFSLPLPATPPRLYGGAPPVARRRPPSLRPPKPPAPPPSSLASTHACTLHRPCGIALAPVSAPPTLFLTTFHSCLLPGRAGPTVRARSQRNLREDTYGTLPALLSAPPPRGRGAHTHTAHTLPLRGGGGGLVVWWWR